MQDSKKEVQCGHDRTSWGPDNCASLSHPMKPQTTNVPVLSILSV
jgi:hypothetical protein